MLTWIEGHLMVLGLVAVFSGFGLGAMWSWARRPGPAGPATPRAAPALARRDAGGSGVRPRYQAR
jgi:hypothetical protein